MMDRANWLDDNADLPEGWALPRLGDGLLSDIQPGFPCGTHNKDGDGVSHLRPMNVNVSGRIDLSVVKSVPTDAARDANRWLESGDVLFNNTNSPELVGKTAYYGLHGRRAFSNHMTRLRVRDDVLDASYCAMALHAHWQAGYFQEVCNNHVSQASISREVLFNTAIPLPPVAEQKRIVQAIERLTARVDAARERLANVPAILKRFRQAVLAAACSGDLTTDWRENLPACEAPTLLPELVQLHHKQAWHDRQTARRAKQAKPDRFVPPDLTQPEELRELPAGWSWIPLGALGADPFNTVQTGPFGAQLHNNEFVLEGVPVIAVGNLTGMSFTTEGLYHITPKKAAALGRYDVNAGDVLFARSGATLGKVCVAPANVKDWRMTGHILRARFERSLILPNMAVFALWGDLVVKDQISGNIRGVTRPGFNTSLLESTWLPVPPLAEQNEIVRRVESLMKLADTIKQRIALASARADRVTQAVLAKAFRGELVPTEADLARAEGRECEPADIMLARLRLSDSSDPPRSVRSRRRTTGSSPR